MSKRKMQIFRKVEGLSVVTRATEELFSLTYNLRVSWQWVGSSQSGCERYLKYLSMRQCSSHYRYGYKTHCFQNCFTNMKKHILMNIKLEIVVIIKIIVIVNKKAWFYLWGTWKTLSPIFRNYVFMNVTIYVFATVSQGIQGVLPFKPYTTDFCHWAQFERFTAMFPRYGFIFWAFSSSYEYL